MSARIAPTHTGLVATCDTCHESHPTTRKDIAREWVDRHVCDLTTLRAIRRAKGQPTPPAGSAA